MGTPRRRKKTKRAVRNESGKTDVATVKDLRYKIENIDADILREKRYRKIAQLIIQGTQPTEAARQAGYAEYTAQNVVPDILSNPLFKRVYQEECAELPTENRVSNRLSFWLDQDNPAASLGSAKLIMEKHKEKVTDEVTIEGLEDVSHYLK